MHAVGEVKKIKKKKRGKVERYVPPSKTGY